MNFSVLDFIFILLITLLIIRCYLKGFISEFMALAGFVLGLLAALFLYKNGADFLRAKFWPDLKSIPEIISFAALFLIVFFLIKLIKNLIIDVVDGAELTNADYIIGLFFGLLEGIAIVGLILFLLRVQPLFDSSSILEGSFFARILLPLITGPEKISGV